MSKVRCRMEIDLSDLAYEVYIENVSHPGQNIDYHEIRDAMAKVFTDWGNKLEEGIESTEEVIKSIH